MQKKINVSNNFLPGFEAIGIDKDTVPDGSHKLTTKQLNFVLNLLKTGQMARSALEAGDGGESLESAGVHASRLIKKPDVQKYYNQCLSLVAQNGNNLVKRVYERSIMLHDKAMACSQIKQELEYMVLTEKHETSSDQGDQVKKSYETKINQIIKKEKHYLTLANQTDTLLANLLGKLSSVTINNIQGDTYTNIINEAPLGENDLKVLAEARRGELEKNNRFKV